MFERLWKRTPQPLIGLDIGSHTAKAVLLKKEHEKLVVTHADTVSVPTGAVVEHEIRDFEAVGNALKPLYLKLGRKNNLVSAAVAGSSVITKVIYVDGIATESDLEAQIQIEADHLIPFPLEEVSLDFEVIPKDEKSGQDERQAILLSACRSEHVESRIAALETAGFTPKVMDIEAYALSRALPLMSSQIPEELSDKIIAMVDIGANMLLFTVVRNGETIYSKEQPFGGEQFNQAVMSYYGMEAAATEKAKIDGELPTNYAFEVLAPFQTQLVQQVRRNLQIFSTSSGYSQADYLIVSGGSSILPGTVELLRDELSIQAILANPFIEMELGPGVEAEKIFANAHQYVLACGLALRSESAHG